MKATVLCLTAMATLLLSGCDQVGPMLAKAGYIHHLGEYAVENVELVPRLPPYGHRWGAGRYLKVELVSSHRLSQSYPTYWIGTASDYCPMKDDRGVLAIGVLDEHGAMLDRPGYKGIRTSKDGHYHYQVFVPATLPTQKPNYDIINDERDLCLQIFGGDHYNVFARSSVIRIPFRDIAKAARMKVGFTGTQ